MSPLPGRLLPMGGVDYSEPDDGLTEAQRFANVLREESVRRVDDRYVHHAVIRNQMRDMADTIDRWERGEFGCSFTSWGECATHKGGTPDRCDRAGT